MDGAIRIEWGEPFPHRERESANLLGRSREYYDSLVKNRQATEFKEYYVLTGEGTTVQLVSGEIDSLHRILTDREFQSIVTQAKFISPKVKVDLLLGGTEQAIREQEAIVREATQALRV